MHIAILNDSDNFHTQKWAKALQSQQLQVSVISFCDAKIEGVNCIEIPPIIGKKRRIWDFLLGEKKLKRIVDEWKIEGIFAINVTPYGILAMQSKVRPCIVFAVGADVLEYPPTHLRTEILTHRNWAQSSLQISWLQKWLFPLRNLFFRHYVKQVLHQTDIVMADNEVLINAIQDWFSISPARTRLNRGGVEPSLFTISTTKREMLRQTFKIPKNKKICLFPRGLKPIYQGDILVKAVSNLLETRTDTYFIFLDTYGDAPVEVVRILENLTATELVLYINKPIPREEVYALWGEVDVFVSAPIYDGYSAAVAEGRYIGAIPVVNDTPATRELFQHKENAWIISDFTPQQIAKELSEVLDNISELKPKFAARNQPWIVEHSLMDDSAAQVKTWFEELKSP